MYAHVLSHLAWRRQGKEPEHFHEPGHRRRELSKELVDADWGENDV